jgi:coniferyl-aldehyde dehydrogenase
MPRWRVPSRQARLDALFALVHDNGERFVEAIAADFGHRSAHETRLLELFPSLEAMRHTRSHFAGWMKPQASRPRSGSAPAARAS